MTVLTRLIGSQSRKAVLLHEVVCMTQAAGNFFGVPQKKKKGT